MKRQQRHARRSRGLWELGISAVVPNLVEGRYLAVAYPADIWEEGLFCGNGLTSVSAMSGPLTLRLTFTRERLFLPMGPPALPPDERALD